MHETLPCIVIRDASHVDDKTVQLRIRREYEELVNEVQESIIQKIRDLGLSKGLHEVCSCNPQIHYCREYDSIIMSFRIGFSVKPHTKKWENGHTHDDDLASSDKAGPSGL